MKSLRNFFKLGRILFALLGLSALSFTSCKERDCVCSYTYDGETYEMFTVTTSDKCEDLEFSYDGETADLDCE
jgi:hypothetical protein